MISPRSLGNFGIDIATVIPEGDNAYSLLLDNGKRLWPAASATRYAPHARPTGVFEPIPSYRRDDRVRPLRAGERHGGISSRKKAIELNAQNAD